MKKLMSIIVASAALASFGGEPALSESLQKNLVVWLDAETNTVFSETAGGLVEWRDVRETGTDASTFCYPRAIVNSTTNSAYADFKSVPPTYYDDTDNKLKGRKAIDFGEFASGKWLYFANQNSLLMRVPVKSFFVVVGLRSTHGHILADIHNLTETGTGRMFFHKGEGGTGNGYLAGKDLSSCVMPYGETRLNGAIIEPTATVLTRNAFSLLSQVGPGAVNHSLEKMPVVSTLFNQGNYTSYRGFSPSRQGGGIICELLLYNRVVTDSERRLIEAYLREKWFGFIEYGKLEIAAGETYSVNTNNYSYEAMSGKGIFEKLDRTTIHLTDVIGYNDVALRFAFGGIYSDAFRGDFRLDPLVGKNQYVHKSSGYYGVNNAVGADAKRCNVIGGASEDEVILDPAAIAGKSLYVTNITAVLMPRTELHRADAPATPEWKGTNLIVNGGFETPWVNPNGQKYTDVDADSGWTKTGPAYVARYESTWYDTSRTVVASNKNVGALQNTASISQTIVPPVSGVYRLKYWLSRRLNRTADSGNNVPVLVVSLDGQPFHRNAVFDAPDETAGSRNQMRYYETYSPYLEKDREYTITFAGDDNGKKDRAVVLDDIVLTPADDYDTRIFVPGGDLLSVDYTPNTAGLGNWITNPTRTFWLGGLKDGGDGAMGYTMNSTWFFYSDSPANEYAENRRLIFLQKDAFVTNRFYAPKAGRVRFSVRYANRSSANPSQTIARNNGHALVASVDNVEIARSIVYDHHFSEMVQEFAITAGEHDLKLACERPSTLDMTVLFNDVQMSYVADDSEITSLGLGEKKEYEVTAPTAGFYALSLPLSGYERTQNAVGDSHIGSKYYPAVCVVNVDNGLVKTQLRAMKSSLEKFEIALPYLTAGTHKVTVEADNNGARPDVIVRTQAPELVAMDYDEFDRNAADSETTIEVNPTAKLELRYSGQYNVRKVIIDGVQRYGEISAETYPDYITGEGSLYVPKRGFTLLFQ